MSAAGERVKPKTARKSFGHVFIPNPSPCVQGFCCCMCGYFTEKLDAKANKLICGHVTYPVWPS